MTKSVASQGLKRGVVNTGRDVGGWVRGEYGEQSLLPIKVEYGERKIFYGNSMQQANRLPLCSQCMEAERFVYDVCPPQSNRRYAARRTDKRRQNITSMKTMNTF